MYCRLKDLSNCRIDVKLERIECWLKMFRIEKFIYSKRSIAHKSNRYVSVMQLSYIGNR